MSGLKELINKGLALKGDKIEDLQGVMAALLGEQFIRRDIGRDFERYEFIRRNEEVMKDILDLCGLELVHNRDYLFYYVISGDVRNRLQLTQAETIVLLILRLLYEEAFEELKVSRGVAAVTNRDIFEKYRAYVNAAKPAPPYYKDTMTSLRKYGIVEYDGAFSSDSDFAVRILPTIAAVIDRAATDDLQCRLKDYGVSREQDG